MKIFSRQFPIKRTNSRGHTTIIEGPNLFGPKSSFHVLKKNASFKFYNISEIISDLVNRDETGQQYVLTLVEYQ